MNKEMAIERITETENLTDHLEDDEAQWLIDWGSGQVGKLLAPIKEEEAAGNKVNELMAVMRKVNQVAGGSASKNADTLAPELHAIAELYQAAFGAAHKPTDEEAKKAAAELAGKPTIEVLKGLLSFVAVAEEKPDKPAAWSVPGDPDRKDNPIKV